MSTGSTAQIILPALKAFLVKLSEVLHLHTAKQMMAVRVSDLQQKMAHICHDKGGADEHAEMDRLLCTFYTDG